MIKAASTWNNNSDLLSDVASLYFREGDKILDATYGQGGWWKNRGSLEIVSNDLYIGNTDYAYDFRKLGFEDDAFDIVAFDPPYVSKGGRETSGIKKFDARYGLVNAARSPEELQSAINDGLVECGRVSRRLVLAKCSNYISSGRYWAGVYWTIHAGIKAGMELIDQFIMVGAGRPQPRGRRQIHSRNNYSVLLVFKTKGVLEWMN